MFATAFITMMVTQPSVSVDVSDLVASELAPDETTRLHGQLVLRLAEEGYQVVAPHLDAAIRLRLRFDDTAWVVERIGDPKSAQRIPLDDPAVARLEALHRVSMAAAKAKRYALPGVTELPSVGVELAVRTTDARAPILLERLAVSLVQAELALVSQPTQGVTLCVALTETHAELSTRHGAGDCPSARVRVERDQSDDMHASVVAASLQLVASPSLPELNESWQLRFGVAGGAIMGKPKTDGTVDLTSSYGPHRGIGGAVDLLLVPSSDNEISVLDVRLLAGPTWAEPLGSKLSLRVAALAGLSLHTFSLAGSDDGARLDWIIALPVTLELRLSSSLLLHAKVMGGVLGTDRRHTLDGTVVWRRQPWFVGVLGGIGMLVESPQ